MTDGTQGDPPPDSAEDIAAHPWKAADAIADLMAALDRAIRIGDEWYRVAQEQAAMLTALRAEHARLQTALRDLVGSWRAQAERWDIADGPTIYVRMVKSCANELAAVLAAPPERTRLNENEKDDDEDAR